MANEANFIIQRKYFHEHMKVLSFFIAFSTICYLPDIRLMHQAYVTLAFLSIAMTYFGVNYFLTGMHSYA